MSQHEGSSRQDGSSKSEGFSKSEGSWKSEGSRKPEGSWREKFGAAEARVRRDFWPTIKRVARFVPFSEDAVAAYYCALDRETPDHVRIALIGALAYFVLPLDAVPDFIPVLGFADDASVLAAAIATVRVHMKDRHRDAARRTLEDESFGVS